jgi:YVTN family beta-propeller protein
MNAYRLNRLLTAGLLASAAFAASQAAHAARPGDADNGTLPLPTGQYITPTAIPGAVQKFLNPGLAAYPTFVAGEAVRSQLSPDGTTLAIVTAGQNSLYTAAGAVDTANSTQYIFLYNVAGGNKANPVLAQVIKQTNAYVGLVFSADGNTLYAAGGNNDTVVVYTKTAGTYSQAATIALGHAGKGMGLSVQPEAGGLALTADGSKLVVVNHYNDSISVIDTATRTVRYEHDLRPYLANNEGVSGAAGGSYPFAVAIKGNGTAYVSSARDREVVVVDISGASSGRLIRRIPLDGNALGMTFNASQTTLYVAQDNADQVAVIDTGTQTVTARIDARAPAGLLPGAHKGAAPFAVTVSPDGSTLYAVNSGSNSVAVIPLTGANALTVTGLIPTAYEPHDITFSADGSQMFIINGKSDTGPNKGHLAGSTGSLSSITYPGGNAAANLASRASNGYQFQLERASLVSAPTPMASDLAALTAMVAQNNFYSAPVNANDVAVMDFLKSRIQHIIYVVKENRTFDQVLGDLNNGSNGDPTITQFGKRITPNIHNLSTRFVTIDNFMNPGDGSMDGWSWAMQGRTTNTESIAQQLNYAAVSRGMSYDTEGTNRNVPVNYPTVAGRDAVAGVAGTTNYTAAVTAANLPGGVANLLAGTANHASTDAPFGAQKGYIHSAVLAAGKTVRNYGFLVNNIGSIGTQANPVSSPFAQGVIQVASLDPELAPYTDLYFRGYDQLYPDMWRYNEWKREFDQFVANGNLPSLTTLRISHDHMGSFGTALGALSSPELQQADCDLATGKIVEAVAHSPYASSTLIIFTEDDVQDGPDHIDSHRAPVLFVGPYVKKGAVVSTPYSQVNALRTIEDILGTQHINLNTAYQRPMSDVFDITQNPTWTYTATASTVLRTSTLNFAKGPDATRFAEGPTIRSTHNAAYWDKVTAGMDFTEADEVPVAEFNRVLWKGLMGSKPYPEIRSGKQLGKSSPAPAAKIAAKVAVK